jgi:hypothetical protein
MRARLRVGCIRRQHDGAAIAGDCRQLLACDTVCLLDSRCARPAARSPSRSTRSSARPFRSPQSAQFDAKTSAQILTQTHADAGYFSRNVRAIEVLIDRDAVASSAAATDGIWQHHDLDPGY